MARNEQIFYKTSPRLFIVLDGWVLRKYENGTIERMQELPPKEDIPFIFD